MKPFETLQVNDVYVLSRCHEVHRFTQRDDTALGHLLARWYHSCPTCGAQSVLRTASVRSGGAAMNGKTHSVSG